MTHIKLGAYVLRYEKGSAISRITRASLRAHLATIVRYREIHIFFRLLRLLLSSEIAICSFIHILISRAFPEDREKATKDATFINFSLLIT